MTTIKELTKETLFHLKDDDISTLPENYFKEFRRQAKLANVQIEEFELFNRINESLTKEEKNDNKIDSFNDLAIVLSNRISTNELRDLIDVFDELLSPSVDFSIMEEMEEIVMDLSKNPQKLVSENFIQKLKDFSKKRVKLDRKTLKDKTEDIVKLTSLMSRYFDKTLGDNGKSSDEINKIKNELVNLNISNASQRELKIVQKKLIDTIYKIENSMKTNSELINSHKAKFEHLNKQIEDLQKELQVAKQEYHIDYLTQLSNRRAYHEEVEKMEKNFSIFDNDYAIVFFDIDHFKSINDDYGHTCGDVVLKKFASILKELTRTEDVIARYGGEEFIALINYQNEIEIQRYLKRIKKSLKETNFIYKDSVIKLKFSAGVSHRNKYVSYLEAKKVADELLYKAKHNGRDKIIFDNNMEL